MLPNGMRHWVKYLNGYSGNPPLSKWTDYARGLTLYVARLHLVEREKFVTHEMLFFDSSFLIGKFFHLEPQAVQQQQHDCGQGVLKILTNDFTFRGGGRNPPRLPFPRSSSSASATFNGKRYKSTVHTTHLSFILEEGWCVLLRRGVRAKIPVRTPSHTPCASSSYLLLLLIIR